MHGTYVGHNSIFKIAYVREVSLHWFWLKFMEKLTGILAERVELTQKKTRNWMMFKSKVEIEALNCQCEIVKWIVKEGARKHFAECLI